jgi:multiple sugar transport system substrate-binding protein
MLSKLEGRLTWLTMAVLLVLVAAACGDSGAGDESAPSELSVWVRQDTQAFYELLAEEYNKTHDTKVVLTPIRQADFVTKVSSAAATGDLPDVLSTDVAFVKRFLDAGTYVEVTDRIDELPFADTILPAYLEASTKDGAQFALPAAIDVSSVFYNKDLFRRAGLDPNAPPSTWDEILQAARAINDLGDDVYGYYFAGRCGGCNGFTMLPMVWADGGEVVAMDSVSVDSPEVRALLEFYREMWADGLMPSGAETDGGESWISAFETGNVGIAPYGSFAVSIFEKAPFDVGAFLIPGATGEVSSFAGGDVMGITQNVSNEDSAWDFIRWMLSDETQVDLIAANGFLVDRTDLADNKYSKENPLIALHNEAAAIAKVPDTAHFNELFTNPAGPWNQLMQGAVFDGDIDGALARAQTGFEEIIATP